MTNVFITDKQSLPLCDLCTGEFYCGCFAVLIVPVAIKFVIKTHLNFYYHNLKLYSTILMEIVKKRDFAGCNEPRKHSAKTGNALSLNILNTYVI